MKKTLLLLLILVLGIVFAQPIPTNFQFIVNENNSSAPPPNFEVVVQMSGAEPFNLGSSNIKFNFNGAALSTPVLVSPLGYDTGFNALYGPMSVTQPVPGIVSINIDLYVPNLGDPVAVAPGWSDVAIVGFTITDPLATSGLIIRSMLEGQDPTVVYQHDQATPNIDGESLPLDVPLPVQLGSFSVEDGVDGVNVKWTTESEIENLGFMLERKTAETAWQVIASYKDNDALKGQGTVSFATDYQFIDKLVENGTEYEYRLADVDYNGLVTYHATRIVTVTQLFVQVIPEEFELFAAYPNPFNPTATIRYNVPTEGAVKITVYNQLGQIVRVLQNGIQQPGEHSLIWDARDDSGAPVSAGVYLYNIEAGAFNKTQKMIFLK